MTVEYRSYTNMPTLAMVWGFLFHTQFKVYGSRIPRNGQNYSGRASLYTLWRKKWSNKSSSHTNLLTQFCTLHSCPGHWKAISVELFVCNRDRRTTQRHRHKMQLYVGYYKLVKQLLYIRIYGMYVYTGNITGIAGGHGLPAWSCRVKYE